MSSDTRILRRSAWEYRVRWKREGRRQSTAIYQSWDSACRKARGILALEAVKHDTSYHTMPDLEEGPVVEQRPVGGWEDAGAVVEASEYAQKSMAQWAEWTNPKTPKVGTTDVPF